MTNESVLGVDVLDEPLAESAPLQLRFAQEHCTEDCRWYHGPRLYLRALGVIRGARNDTPFLLTALREVARETEHARVLVSGAADYGMLAHVAAAWARARRSLDVTVVDKCLTPLRMNRWFGDRAGIPVRVHHGDLFGLEIGSPFDLICTHAFVGRFDAEGRQRLAKKWHSLLRQGGAVVTAHRMRRGTSDRSVRLTARQKERLRERARHALSVSGSVDATPEMIAGWTTEFLRRKTTHPVCTIEDIEAPLATAGFTVAISRTASDDGSWRMGVVARRLRDS